MKHPAGPNAGGKNGQGVSNRILIREAGEKEKRDRKLRKNEPRYEGDQKTNCRFRGDKRDTIRRIKSEL